MALASAALWAWSRERPVAAGVLIGLGTAAKLYPVFLLVPLLDPRRPHPPLRAGAVGGVPRRRSSWLTVNLPIAMAYHHGWWAFYKFSDDRPAERSSVWAVGQDAGRQRHQPDRLGLLGAARRGGGAGGDRRRC